MHRLAEIIALAAIAVVPGAAFAAEPASAQSSFISTAAQTGMMGVEAARLAVSVSKNEAVREFAYAVIYDHEQMNEQLARIAAKLGIALPSGLDPEHARALQVLRDASPQEFDAAYFTQVISEHDKTVDLLQSNLLNADIELAVFSSYNLPRERAHGRVAGELKSRLSTSN